MIGGVLQAGVAAWRFAFTSEGPWNSTLVLVFPSCRNPGKLSCRTLDSGFQDWSLAKSGSSRFLLYTYVQLADGPFLAGCFRPLDDLLLRPNRLDLTRLEDIVWQIEAVGVQWSS